MWRTLTAPVGSGVTAGSAEEGPEHERERDQDAGDDEQDVTAVLHAFAEGVHAHTVTLGPGADPARTRRSAPSPSPRQGHGGGGCQCAVIDGMRMLWARAARAELASSQSGSLVRRTNELCASHSAVHDVHVSRYEPPE